ncbi:MAG: trypsin-like peptidase domain-containing protein [Candidatus Sungbacteria bacterium]|nr:trypsin-like peptidase domain-containing protein [Candidatus Sungbacteria bacterium]
MRLGVLMATTIIMLNPVHIHAGPLMEDTFIKLIKSAKPGVVHITTTQKQFDPLEKKTRFVMGVGSGLLVNHGEKVKVLTNKHVVEDAIDISVTLLVNKSERKVAAEIDTLDSYTDLALLSLTAADQHIFSGAQTLSLGGSDNAEEGQWVLAIGNPMGLSMTSQKGIISAIGRSVPLGFNTPPHDFIQIDADINPGNSGGPLFNLKGEVIGIVTAIYSQTGQSAGIGFAIPAKIAKDFLETRAVGKRGVSSRAGWIGLLTQAAEEDLLSIFNHPRNALGLLVARVDKPSPAQEAGIKQGDLITSLSRDGTPLPFERATDFERIVSGLPIGSILNITYLREGREKRVAIKVHSRPE